MQVVSKPPFGKPRSAPRQIALGSIWPSEVECNLVSTHEAQTTLVTRPGWDYRESKADDDLATAPTIQ